MTTTRFGSLLVSLILLQGVAACSTGAGRELPPAERVPSLVVPPDLNVPKGESELSVPDGPGGSATYSGYAGASTGNAPALLTDPGDLRMERAGGQRWLVVSARAETLWPVLKAFLQTNHLPLARENPATGILETQWTQEAQDRKTLGGTALGMRDQFRLRLERGISPGTSEIYLSHRGVVQIGCGRNRLWQARAPEPETETQMLRRLMLFLGAQEAQANTLLSADPGKPRAKRVSPPGQEAEVIRMGGDMDTAWRRVGLALERIGFVLEDRDRTKGIYYVRASDAVKSATQPKKGFFSWFGGDKEASLGERYQIRLRAQPARDKEPVTDVGVADAAGALDTSAMGERIMGLLFEQLK